MEVLCRDPATSSSFHTLSGQLPHLPETTFLRFVRVFFFFVWQLARHSCEAAASQVESAQIGG